jgi:hypothetical protein
MNQWINGGDGAEEEHYVFPARRYVLAPTTKFPPFDGKQ